MRTCALGFSSICMQLHPTGHLSHYDKHDVCGIHNLKMSFLLRLERWCICATKGMDFD